MRTRNMRAIPALIALISGFLVAAEPGQNGAEVARGARGDSPAVGFSLGEVTGMPGEIVELPFEVRTNKSLAMVTWSLEYDPAVITFLEPVIAPDIERILERVPVFDSQFVWFGDAEEGWAQVSLVMDFEAREGFSLPPGLARRLALMRFQVRPDAAEGTYPVKFTSPESAGYEGHFRRGNAPVYNRVRAHGRPFTQQDQFEGATEPELNDGVVIVAQIIGDVGIFLRGDANLDSAVNISDPLTILTALYLDGAPLECPRAADANDDSRIDISDPVTILIYLFRGATSWSPSTELVGDESALSCSID